VALPANGVDASLEDLAQVPAVALFLHRAHAVRPGFALTEGNARAIADVCAQLDGLPLAIEFAAARSKLLSPQAILEHLSNRLRLLTGGGPDWPPRHHTMRAAIGWSYDLLCPSEQALFRYLSVFVDGCALDTIEAVFDAETVVSGKNVSDASILDDLAALVDHSLLLREEGPDGEMRFRMLEIIREYARERLIERGEADRIQRAQAAYFLDFTTNARIQIDGAGRRAAHARVHREMDNLRATLTWLHARGDTESAQRLAIELARFWIDLGYVNEGRGWVERVIAMSGPVSPTVHAEALYWASGCANLQDATVRATDLARQSMELARAHRNQLGVAMALTEFGEAEAATDLDHARTLIEEALSIFRELDDPVREGMALGQLGRFAHRQGAYQQAADYHAAALTLWRRLDHPWGIPSTLRDQATEALVQGELATAWTMYQGSLVHWQKLDERIHMSDCLSGLARVSLASGKAAQAALLLGAEDALNETMGYVPSQNRHAVLVDETCAVMGKDAFDMAGAEGRSRPLEAVIDEVLAMTLEDGAASC
jgi:predicted ATPase